MWTYLKRTACPVLLLLGGSAALYFGATRHRVEVFEEKEREISIAIPMPFGMGPSFDREESPAEPPGDAGQPPRDDERPGAGNPFAPSSPGAAAESGSRENPFDSPAAPAGDAAGNPFEGPSSPDMPPALQMRMQKVIERSLEAQDEPEWRIVWDATVGGITRLDNGQLKRTYSGKPPALCPT